MIQETEAPYYYAVEFCPNSVGERIVGDNRHLTKKLEFEKVSKPDEIKRFASREQAEKMSQLAEKRESAVVKILCNLYDSEI
jgi:hypothetical protein